MTGKTGRPRLWSAEEDALLRDLYLEGKSTAYLADRFDTTIVNVKQRLSRMGVRRGPSTALAPEALPDTGGKRAAWRRGSRGSWASPPRRPNPSERPSPTTPSEASSRIPEAFMVRQCGRSARGSRDTYLRYNPEVWREWVEKLALD